MNRNKRKFKIINDVSKNGPPVDEIRIHFNFNNPKKRPITYSGIKYIYEPVFSKAIKFSRLKKIKNYSFDISGVQFALKNKTALKKVFKQLQLGSEITARHEFKNKFDEYACALFYKKQKLGYIPKYLNKKILHILKNGSKINFFIATVEEGKESDSRLNKISVIAIVSK